MRTSHLLALTMLLLVNPSVSSAEAPPSRKSGLWEVSITSDNGLPSNTMKECVDQSSDESLMQMGAEASKSMGSGCSQNEIKRTAAGFEATSTCEVGPSTITSKSVFSGDFSKAYSGYVTTSFNPPLFGKGNSKTTISAKHLGACPADMKPGDVIMANGMKMNMLDSASQAKEVTKMLQKSGPGAADLDMDMDDVSAAIGKAQKGMTPEQMKAIHKAMREMQAN